MRDIGRRSKCARAVGVLFSGADFPERRTSPEELGPRRIGPKRSWAEGFRLT